MAKKQKKSAVRWSGPAALAGRYPYCGLILVLALTSVVFGAALRYDFMPMIDDGAYVLHNPLLIWSFDNLGRIFSRTFILLYSPLPVATYMIDYALGGLDPMYYHLQNLLWHLAGTALVFAVLRKMKLQAFWALFFAACYAVHPQRAESVVWIAERKDVLLAFFFWSAILCHLSRGRAGRIGTPLLTAAAVLCKPPGVFVPAICYLLDVIRLRRWSRTRSEWLELAPSAVVALIYFTAYRGLLAMTADYMGASLNFRLGFFNMLRYPGKILLPLELSPIYPDTVFTPGLTGAVIVAFGLLAGGFRWLWRHHRRIAELVVLPSVCGFYLLLGPTLGFFGFSNAEFADRYSLLPGIMLYIPAGVLLSRCRWGRTRRWLWFAALAYPAMLGAMCHVYQAVWRNEETFFRWVIEAPNPSANTLFRVADYLYAADDFETLWGVLTHPKIKDTDQSRLLQRFVMGAAASRRDGAVETLRWFDESERALALKELNYRGGIDLYVMLADHALRRGERAEAQRCYGEIVRNYGEDPFISAFYRGMNFRLDGNLPEAIREWREALRIRPDDRPTRMNLELAERKLKEQN